MGTVPLNLGLGSNVGKESQATSIRHINCYVEETGQDGKNTYAIYSAPGLTRWDNGSFAGINRGLIELNDSNLVAFLGNEIVQYDTAGASTRLTTIVGSGRLSLSKNRKTTTQITAVTNAGQAFVLESGVLAAVSDPDLPSPNWTTYVKGVTVYSIADGRVFHSAVDESTSINAASFGTANSQADGNVAVFENSGFLYIFGRKSIEIWQLDPALAGEPFLFSPVQQDIPLGCLSGHSIAQVGSGLAWVDNDGIVRYGRDGGAQRISSHTVERAIEDLTTAERANVAGRQWFFQGHEFYTLFSDQFTWNYDLTTGKWSERISYGDTKWLANDIIGFAGGYIAASGSDGNLYEIDALAHDEDGTDLVMEVQAPFAHRFPDGGIVDRLDIDGGRGVGRNVGGAGLYFDDGAYITFGDVLDQTGSFTLEARVNPDATKTTPQRFIVKDDGTTGWGFDLSGSAAGSLRFFHRSLNTIVTESAASAVSFGSEQHVASVFDAAADTVTLYVDGIQVAQTTGQTNAIAGNSNALNIGNSPTDPNGDRDYTGFIRDARVWNVARSQAQIQANMAATLVGNETGLVGYWKLDEQTGVVANDTSPSNFDGAITGPAVWSSAYRLDLINPEWIIDYSDDGAKTFRGERRSSMGALGKFKQKTRMNKWGRIDSDGRIWRIRASAAVPRSLFRASMAMRPTR